jgi:hypothetical protein
MNEKYKIMREKKPSSFPLMSHNIIVLITTENFKTIIEEDFYFGNKEITNDKTLKNECTCGMCLINYHMCASYLILSYLILYKLKTMFSQVCLFVLMQGHCCQIII